VAQVAERIGPPYQPFHSRYLARPVAAEGCHLLRQHVEAVARRPDGLDLARAHALGDDRALEQVAAVLGDADPAADLAHLVFRATHPLQPPRYGAGGFHLDDQVQAAYVNTELERAGGDDAPGLALLEGVFDLGAPFVGDAAVVGANQLLSGQLVHLLDQPLAEPSGVDEPECAAVGADLRDLRDQPGVDGRPEVRWRGRGATSRV
jgi:hypothetical protein